AFTDNWMGLHLTTLVERERTYLLEKPRREANLPDVVDQPGHMSELLLVGRQSEPTSDVSRICRNRRGMPGRVPITGIERRDQRCGEGEVRSLLACHGTRELP